MPTPSVTQQYDNLAGYVQTFGKLVTRLFILLAISICLNLGLLVLLFMH